jgi:hypothetical protein
MTRRKLVSADEARPAKTQHTKPCGDCPWRRDSLAGWLGGLDVMTWLRGAHGDEQIECHTRTGAQCAGAAIYRANVCKMSRDPQVLRLQADRARVFATPQEFKEHHSE